MNRRDFLKTSLATGAMVSAPFSNVLGANDAIRLGVIGVGSSVKIGGMGKKEIGAFLKLPGVRFTALCDCDQAHLEPQLEKLKKHNPSIKGYTDLRDLLDDRNVDAVIVTTPNHWHALATIWACQAGKDVYVQKPTSHTIFEGRKMVEAAAKYQRIVQAPHAPRDRSGLGEAFAYIRKGHLGKIRYAHGLNYKARPTIGKVNGPQPIPSSLDYNLWSGPASMAPLQREYLHYDWHWDWSTGDGDLGNMGIHYMDGCRWGPGQNTLPKHVMSIGGRFGYDDDGETPNTQIIFLDYDPAPIIFEVSGLPATKQARARSWGAKQMDEYRGGKIGTIIQCEGGYVSGGSGFGKAAAYDNQGNRIKTFEPTNTGVRTNFLDVIRSRKTSDLNAPILQGHLSGALVHMANISHRLAQNAASDEIRAAIGGNATLADAFARFEQHLAAHEIDLAKTLVRMGPMLTMNPNEERFEGLLGPYANMYVSRNYRAPFVVPHNV